MICNKTLLPALLLISILMLPQCKSEQSKTFRFTIVNEALSEPESPFYIDREAYQGDLKSLPIGIFDSGTGGLAVLEAILSLDAFNNSNHQPGSDGIPDFISESFIYLADEANMPYGKYDAENKADFLEELVIKDVLFLSGQMYYLSPEDLCPEVSKKPVKEIVIACNTATAFGLETAKSVLDFCQLPLTITGIIEAGAKTAIETLLEKEISDPLIAVLATEGTCSSEGYPNTIYKVASTRMPGTELKVIQQAGIGLAGAIDGDINYIDPGAASSRNEDDYYGPGIGNQPFPLNPEMMSRYNFENGNELFIRQNQDKDTTSIQLNSVRNYVRYVVTQLVNSSASQYPDRSIDIVILGCTHYPYEETEIREHFDYLRENIPEYKTIIPENIIFIDPAKSLAMLLYEDLVRDDLLGNNSMDDSEFYISVPNTILQENIIDENIEFPFKWKYGRDINTGLQYVKIVPFSDKWIDPEIRRRISEKLPVTYSLIN